jgi:hypothetical protein
MSNLVFFFYFGLICSSCKKSPQNDILDLVYIEGIHNDHEILRADSFFLKGKLNEAAILFKQPKKDVSKQLYCQARLAEMDYYLRELYGKHHQAQTLDSLNLPGPVGAIDSFLLVVYDFYSKERLDTSKFNYLLNRVTQQLGPQHYLSNLGNFILGEYFYTMNFNNQLLDTYFKTHQNWCSSFPQKIYDCYWTNIRLSSEGLYDRDNLKSIVNSNELISDNEWRSILDEIHLSLAHSSLGYVLYRLDEFEKSYKENEEAILLSKHTLASPVYQEALKSQLTVTNFWSKDSLWQIYIKELKQNIDSVGTDYVNYYRHVARLYYERGEFKKAIPYHKLAVEYCQKARHLNFPVLNSLCYIYSVDMEKAGFYEQAINIYLLGDLGYVDSTWTYRDLIDSSRLAVNYQFVSLERYGHIYYSWFLKDENIDLLNKAEELALLAHSLYFRDVDTRDEYSLLSFSGQRKYGNGVIVFNLCREIP